MRRFSASVCMAAALLAAQPSVAQSSTPTFKSRTELVLVPVLVSDKSGPVHGLTRDDFAVLDNGTNQKLATFEEVSTSDTPIAHIPAKDGFYTNAVTESAGPRRVTIIALDSINSGTLIQADARRQVLDYLLKKLRPGTPIGLVVFTRGGVRVVHDVTTNSEALIAALNFVMHRQTQGESAAPAVALPVESGPAAAGLQDFVNGISQMQQFDSYSSALTTLQALRTLAHQMHGIPGRKSLIWVTSGFSINDTTQQAGPRPGGEIHAPSPEFAHTMQLLNDANIALYPIDARGLLTGQTGLNADLGPQTYRSLSRSTSSSLPGQVNFETMQTVATLTGGRAFHGTNDIGGAIEQAERDSASYYMLGFYLNRAEAKPGWHELRVTVRHPGAQVRARNRFFVDTTAPEPSAAREVAIAVNSPVDYTELPLKFRWSNTTGTGSNQSIGFELGMGQGALTVDADERNHVNFDVAALARPLREGRRPERFNRTIDGHLNPHGLEEVAQHGMKWAADWKLPPGDYNVRFVVRDNLSGHIGSITAPLKVAP